MQARDDRQEETTRSRWGLLSIVTTFFLTAFILSVYRSLLLAALVGGLGTWLSSRKISWNVLPRLIIQGAILVAIAVLIHSHGKGAEPLELVTAGVYYTAFSVYFMLVVFALRTMFPPPRSKSGTPPLHAPWKKTLAGSVLAIMLASAGKALWDSQRTRALLDQKARIMQWHQAENPSAADLDSIFPSHQGILRHAAGGDVHLQTAEQGIELIFLDVPAGDVCWEFAFLNNVPGVDVEVNSKVLYGEGGPRTSEELAASQSSLCGSSWNILGKVTVKFIFSDDRRRQQ